MNTQTNLIQDLDIEKFKKRTLKFFNDKTLVIVYNLQKKQNNFMIDAFTEKEFINLQEIVNCSLIKHTILLEDEKEFCEQIQELAKQNIVVLNLSRRGSLHNKKLLVTAYCDIFDIPCISSSGYTVNVCRNKFHFQQHLLQQTKFGIQSFIINHSNKKKILDKLNSKWVIIKQIQSAGSHSLTEKSIFELTEDKLRKLYENKEIVDTHIIQEYVSGDEVEIAFFIINGKTHIINPYILEYNGALLTEEISTTENYRLSPYNYSEDILRKLYEATDFISSYFYFNFYGRIDFKIFNDTIKIFDIATTPYFLDHTSISKFIIDKDIPVTPVDLILFSYVTSYSLNQN